MGEGMKKATVITLLTSAVVFACMLGCAPPPAVEEKTTMTPEEQKAYQDSLREAQMRDLKIIRSFANEHYNHKFWEEAAKYYAELAQKDTGHVFNDYGKWAQCCVQMNVSADSVKMIYQQGLAAFSDDAYLHASLGHIFRTLGVLDSAVVHYEAATKLDEQIEYKKILAELYVRLGRSMEAIDLYRIIINAEPENKEIASILEDLVKRYLSPEEYIKSLETSVAQFPDDLDKKFALAKAYSDAGQNNKALDQLEIILQKEPQNLRALEMTGNVHQNLRNYPAALSAYGRILVIEENPRIMVEMSHVNRDLGNYSEARSFARRALAKDSKLGSAITALASIYETAADLKTAGKPPTYTDKLVFLIAYGLYQDAANSGDFTVMDEAKSHMNYLRDSQLIPAYSDWFMHQKEKDPTAVGGYKWIDPNWPELGYIGIYLERISSK